MLVLICGLPGSGKSISAKKIATFFRGTHLNTDIIRRKVLLQGSPELSAAHPDKYDLEYAFDRLLHIPPPIQELIWKQKEFVYERLFEETERELRVKNVVLDATFFQKKNRQRAYRTARATGTDVYVIECQAATEVIKSRLARRKYGKRASNVATIEVFEEVKKKYEDPRQDGVPLLVYDTSSDTFRYFNVISTKDLSMLKKMESILRTPLHILRQG